MFMAPHPAICGEYTGYTRPRQAGRVASAVMGSAPMGSAALGPLPLIIPSAVDYLPGSRPGLLGSPWSMADGMIRPT
jgi:hypothetical protein